MTTYSDKRRVKSLFLITIFSLSLPAFASLEKFIGFLSNDSVTVQSACMEEDNLWKRDADQYGPIKLACPSDWYAKDFHFDLAYYHCQTRYGKSAQTCTELDANKVIQRAGNSALIKEMEDFASDRFSDYKEKLGKTCCEGKAQCLNRFNSTALRFTEETKSEASYLSDTNPNGLNRIEISRGKMASTMNRESLERVLLVELAHACQFALISESAADYKFFTTDRCSVESGRKMFLEGLGPEVGSCVDQELQAQIAAIPETERGKYCFGKWYREAFSDMKFRSEFKSIYHWTYDFLRRSQHKNYASVYKYIRCGMTPEIRSQVCK